MKRLEILFGVIRVPLDALCVQLALVGAFWFRAHSIDLIPGVQLLEPATTLPSPAAYMSGFVLWSVLLFLFLAAALRLYNLRATGSAWNEIGRVIVASLLWLALVIAWYFIVRKQLFYSRILLLHSTVFIAALVVVARSLLVLVQRFFLRRGMGVRYALTVGKHAPSDTAKITLEHDVHYAYKGHVASLDNVKQFLQRHDLDLVIQTDANPDSEDTASLIDFCRSHHVGYAFLPPVFADVPHLLSIDRLGLLPLLRFKPTPLDGWGRVWKACFDLAASAVLIVVLSPLLLIIAVAILIDDGWPIFYVSRRVGERGKGRIPVLKFRSMIKDADARKAAIAAQNHRTDGPLFKVKHDPRVTRVGRILRRWSLDEFPQLFNVLAGQMALVGPRPHLPEEVERYTPFQRRVFAIRPGMTGLAQISGRSDLSFDDEVAFDLRYIEEWSPVLDFWILWRTAMVVFGRKGAD